MTADMKQPKTPKPFPVQKKVFVKSNNGTTELQRSLEKYYYLMTVLVFATKFNLISPGPSNPHVPYPRYLRINC